MYDFTAVTGGQSLPQGVPLAPTLYGWLKHVSDDVLCAFYVHQGRARDFFFFTSIINDATSSFRKKIFGIIWFYGCTNFFALFKQLKRKYSPFGSHQYWYRVQKNVTLFHRSWYLTTTDHQISLQQKVTETIDAAGRKQPIPAKYACVGQKQCPTHPYIAGIFIRYQCHYITPHLQE